MRSVKYNVSFFIVCLTETLCDFTFWSSRFFYVTLKRRVRFSRQNVSELKNKQTKLCRKIMLESFSYWQNYRSTVQFYGWCNGKASSGGSRITQTWCRGPSTCFYRPQTKFWQVHHGGGGLAPSMHHRSHDQHPWEGWLPNMHHRSHTEHMIGIQGGGGWLSSMHHRSHDQWGLHRHAVGTYPIGVLSCWKIRPQNLM